MARRSVAVRIRGQEFRIRSDEDEEELQRVAALLDETMQRVEQKTGTVDSQRLATLTGLNLAREVLELRRALETSGVEPARLRSLVDRVESALDGSAAAN